jgi:hypothetical protein
MNEKFTFVLSDTCTVGLPVPGVYAGNVRSVLGSKETLFFAA